MCKRPGSYRLVPILIAALAICSACTTQQRPAAVAATLPADQVATITCKNNLVIVSIDGDTSYRVVSGDAGTSAAGCQIQLAPGEHVVTAHYRITTARDQAMFTSFETTESEPVQLELNALAGHTYHLDYSNTNGNWRPFFRDVTQQPALP